MKLSKITFYAVIILLSHSYLWARTYLPIYKADFWIKRLANPGEIILTPAQIKEFNNTILSANDEMARVEEMGDTVSKQTLVEWLLKDPLPQDKTMFDRKRKPVQEEFYKKILDNMNREGINESQGLLFGIVAKRADIRAFPTDEPVLKSPSAGEFDTFQYSAIYPPQPVALLHKSKDNAWGFFQTGFVRGWIKLSAIAFARTMGEIKINSDESLIITGSKVSIFTGPKNKRPLETVPMGTKLSLTGEDKNYWIVRFSQRDEEGQLKWIDAYIAKKADVHIGYLAYTKRNVIRQAFKILGEKYGWGGIHGLRDCSSFIQDVFATMGINLPRNSNHQATVGTILANLDESTAFESIKKAMDSAVPGITLFGLKGHIMLYLGNIDGSYYTLHQFFGYYDKDGFRTINKAVVTNLDLGSGSKMGTIKDRVKSINLVTLE